MIIFGNPNFWELSVGFWGEGWEEVEILWWEFGGLEEG